MRESISKGLKIGDRIRITSLPQGFLQPETTRVYKKLIKRNRPITISEIDEDGTPWYECRFRKKNGTLEYHFLSVYESDNNWVRVKTMNPQITKVEYARLNCGDYYVKIFHDDGRSDRIKTDNLEDVKKKYPNNVFEEVSKMEMS